MEKQSRWGLWRFFQQIQPFRKRTHLELGLIILDNGDSDLEKIDFLLNKEIIPNPPEKLPFEASREYRQKPRHQIHPGFQFNCLKVIENIFRIDFHEVIEQLNSGVNLVNLSSEEREKMVSMDQVGKSDQRRLVLK